jgi:hypothetical protein
MSFLSFAAPTLAQTEKALRLFKSEWHLMPLVQFFGHVAQKLSSRNIRHFYTYAAANEIYS